MIDLDKLKDKAPPLLDLARFVMFMFGIVAMWTNETAGFAALISGLVLGQLALELRLNRLAEKYHDTVELGLFDLRLKRLEVHLMEDHAGSVGPRGDRGMSE